MIFVIKRKSTAQASQKSQQLPGGGDGEEARRPHLFELGVKFWHTVNGRQRQRENEKDQRAKERILGLWLESKAKRQRRRRKKNYVTALGAELWGRKVHHLIKGVVIPPSVEPESSFSNPDLQARTFLELLLQGPCPTCVLSPACSRSSAPGLSPGNFDDKDRDETQGSILFPNTLDNYCHQANMGNTGV